MTKRRSPSFNFYYDAWLADTSELTLEEKGLYIDLMARQARHGYITDERLERIFSNIAGAREAWESGVKEYFSYEPERGWLNKRVAAEVERRKAFIASRRANLLGGGSKQKKKERAPVSPHIEKRHPRLAEMEQPLTAEEHARLVHDYGDAPVETVLAAMNAYEGILKYKSTNLTARNWLKMRGVKKIYRPKGKETKQKPTSLDEMIAISKRGYNGT